MRFACADWLQRREILGPVKYITADFDPVIHKDRLHLRHHGTLDTIVRIAPMLRILGMASPLICDTNTAGDIVIRSRRDQPFTRHNNQNNSTAKRYSN